MLRHESDITRNTAVYELGFNDFYGPDVTGKFIFPDGVIPPTEEAIQTKLAELHAEYDAQEYARNRAAEYPSTGDQLDMMYKDNKNSTTTHADAVEAVKTKWPKDNSGPV